MPAIMKELLWCSGSEGSGSKAEAAAWGPAVRRGELGPAVRSGELGPAVRSGELGRAGEEGPGPPGARMVIALELNSEAGSWRRRRRREVEREGERDAERERGAAERAARRAWAWAVSTSDHRYTYEGKGRVERLGSKRRRGLAGSVGIAGAGTSAKRQQAAQRCAFKDARSAPAHALL